MRKIHRFLAQNFSQCNFGLFLPKFGCHGNYLSSLEILGSIFEFADHTRPHMKIRGAATGSISRRLANPGDRLISDFSITVSWYL